MFLTTLPIWNSVAAWHGMICCGLRVAVVASESRWRCCRVLVRLRRLRSWFAWSKIVRGGRAGNACMSASQIGTQQLSCMLDGQARRGLVIAHNGAQKNLRSQGEKQLCEWKASVALQSKTIHKQRYRKTAIRLWTWWSGISFCTGCTSDLRLKSFLAPDRAIALRILRLDAHAFGDPTYLFFIS